MHKLVKQQAKGFLQETSGRKTPTARNSKGKLHLATRGDSSDDDNDLRVGKYTEASSIYTIQRILSSDQYAVGKNIQNYLEGFSV